MGLYRGCEILELVEATSEESMGADRWFDGSDFEKSEQGFWQVDVDADTGCAFTYFIPLRESMMAATADARRVMTYYI